MTALDTNVIIDLEEGAPEVAERALRAIENAGERAALVVSGVVYAELCARPSPGDVEIATRLGKARIAIDVDLPVDTWREAGLAYASYCRRREKSGGGSARRILADFIIGAHACRVGTLVTSDADFYRRAFPSLRVVGLR
jgi:predicted nucleic acid-binding protein